MNDWDDYRNGVHSAKTEFMNDLFNLLSAHNAEIRTNIDGDIEVYIEENSIKVSVDEYTKTIVPTFRIVLGNHIGTKC